MTRQDSAAALAPAPAAALPNRWTIAFAGVAVQLMLGTVYAWSIFKKPLMASHHWQSFQVGTTFALTILFLGLSAAFGGRLVDRAGTRKIASIAAVLFGIGTMLAGLAHQIGSLYLLWIGYGVIAGIGNGLGYVTPVAVLTRWFPDKKGLITGMAVMGFGLGAAFMSLLGQAMIENFGRGAGVWNTFYICGALFLVGILLCARKLVNPPAGYAERFSAARKAAGPAGVELAQARRTPQLYILWGILFFNVAAGIALVANLGNMAIENVKLTAEQSRGFGSFTGSSVGRLLYGLKPSLMGVVSSIIVMAGSFCNGFGRIFWGGLSEKIGRRNVFLLIFITQLPLFILLPHISSLWLFMLAACYILLCYGGGFGTMPSFTADTFGSKNMGAIYGVVLLAWGVAGGVGPGIMEWMYATTKSFELALYIAAGLLAAGLVLTLLYRKPKIAQE